ncbi:hypothetical protein [Rhodanobacter sp. C01]|uniref:hypothetical protein n=1 Tax=Rhodanobacter sp. C01 TaxID=1945856 RepID=UPI0009846990|nr:hypothetical protein [Rhodanobacter sp. C01]OOG46905.1 hypothetical protein B0E50_13170 [Rhodanobacter sp. C01]
MTSTKPLGLPRALLLATSSLAVAGTLHAAGSGLLDYSGIWRLDEQHSDSPSDIDARLRLERKREEPVQQPASSSSTGTPSAGQKSGQHGGHGGGNGMGGHGGHGGGRGQSKTSTSDNGTAPPDAPPPLLADDSLLNVQQDAKGIRVVLGDKDQLDSRLDGFARQSLNGSAMVQSQLTATGLQISMQFDGDVRLRQDWVQSPDGHHLTVTETWTTPAVQQPIVFKRSYDRLDM